MYSKLDKNLKKKARENFFSSQSGQDSKKSFIRIIVSILLLIIYSVCMLIFNENNWWEYYLSAISFISAILLSIFTFKVFNNLINEFLSIGKKTK